MNDNHIRVGDASIADTLDTARRGHARIRPRTHDGRLRAARFDRALAVGVPAPAGSALAAHAARLTSVAERRTIARVLRRAVRDAKDTRATQSARVPMHRANIASAEALIDEVTLRLHAPHPGQRTRDGAAAAIAVRRSRPLYRYGSGDLAGRLGAVLAAL